MCVYVYYIYIYVYIISIYKLMHVLALGLFVINRSISSKSQSAPSYLECKKKRLSYDNYSKLVIFGVTPKCVLDWSPIYSIVGVAPFLLLKTSIIRISWLQPQVIPISRVHLHISLSNDIPCGLKSGKVT